MKSTLLILFIGMISSSNCFCQARFVNEGNSMGIYGSFDSESETNGRTNALTFGGVYTLLGLLDIIVEYDQSNYSNDTDDYLDIEGTGLTFGAFYHIKSEVLPFNIKLGGYYGTASVQSDLLHDLDWELTGKISAFGGGIYKSILGADSYKIVPTVAYFAVNSEMTSEGAHYHATETDSYNVLVFGIGVLLNNSFWIEPSVAQKDGSSEFQLGLGYLLQL